MYKILKSLLTICAVSVIAAGSSSAYFTNTNTIEGMTFATGTLQLTDSSADWTKTVSFANMKPGDSIRKWVTLTNTGTLDVNALTLSAVNKTGDSLLLDNMRISATGRVGSNDPAYFTNDWAAVKPNVNSWMNNADMLDVAFYRTPAGVIHPGESYTMTLDFTIPSDADNSIQGLTAAFDMQFDAVQ